MLHNKGDLITDLTTEIKHICTHGGLSLLTPSPCKLPGLRSGAEALASRPAPLRLIMFTLPAMTHFISAWKAHRLLQAPPWLLLSLTTSTSKQSLLFTCDISQPCQGWLIKMTVHNRGCEAGRHHKDVAVLMFNSNWHYQVVCCLSFGIQLKCLSEFEIARSLPLVYVY